MDYYVSETTGLPLTLAGALEEHNADAIGLLSKIPGFDEISPKEDAIMLVAHGGRLNDIDDRHTQSMEGISRTLEAMKAAGIDHDEVRDGLPAAHRLVEHYGPGMMKAFYSSFRDQAGMSDMEHAQRLAAFARAGVDFDAVDASGDKPLDRLMKMAEHRFAEKRPYDYDFKPLSLKDMKSGLKEEYQPVKDAAREFRVTQIVNQMAQKASLTGQRQSTTPRDRSGLGPSDPEI